MPNPDRHLWLLPDSAAEAFIAHTGGPALLDAAERERCERVLAPPERRRRLAARLLARHALSSRTGLPLDSWRFHAASDGRPEPEPSAEHRLRFNLSHTDGLTACVVTDGGRACGVDAERSPAGADAVAHLPRFFADRERAELAAVPDAVLPEHVAAYWVLKEAYLKALGTGLRRDLSTIAFTGLTGGNIRLYDTGEPEPARERWHFDLIHPSPGHVVAVAAEEGTPGGLFTTTLTN
ncbi:4'-phosphopantetheinyl transferase superfamily protein [Streptomyces sp. SID12501]|uniref:4'-phosphopantetheinyl transferase superfamily protein n=1 Tax=Streptomyces sp. SID12501 TaxID=2706042 RepID=A0A6B3BGY3_9ACTN|nr:4'-phosphopantetheinyl transferase superfamily protein [Streptomyces sp. SID12501]NEC84554.1 4'-phosphopantetheinyl transferase superfamily protein [Streptomyces sp. SID12501]